MSWNYRVCKETYKGTGYEEVYFSIHEAYYNKDGEICMVTENAVGVGGDNLEEIRFVLEKMQLALTKEVVDLDTIVFGKYEDKNADLV